MYTHPACARVQTAAPDGRTQTRGCKNSKAHIHSNRSFLCIEIIARGRNCVLISRPSPTLYISSDRVTFALYIYRKKNVCFSAVKLRNVPRIPSPYWHQLFVFSISDWFPIVHCPECTAAVRCVSCYSKPWLVHFSLAACAEIQTRIRAAAILTSINNSIASTSLCQAKHWRYLLWCVLIWKFLHNHPTLLLWKGKLSSE